MVVKVFLGQGYIFQRDRPFAAFKFQKFIDPNPTHNLVLKKAIGRSAA
jgi:hypothetical protein